jgi:hypothetical protein
MGALIRSPQQNLIFTFSSSYLYDRLGTLLTPSSREPKSTFPREPMSMSSTYQSWGGGTDSCMTFQASSQPEILERFPPSFSITNRPSQIPRVSERRRTRRFANLIIEMTVSRARVVVGNSTNINWIVTKIAGPNVKRSLTSGRDTSRAALLSHNWVKRITCW